MMGHRPPMIAWGGACAEPMCSGVNSEHSDAATVSKGRGV